MYTSVHLVISIYLGLCILLGSFDLKCQSVTFIIIAEVCIFQKNFSMVYADVKFGGAKTKHQN